MSKPPISLKFRQENEVKLPYAKRISKLRWKKHKKFIHNLHTQRKFRNDILNTLGEQCGFHPTIKQFNARMKAWGLMVYPEKGHPETESVDPDVVDANIPSSHRLRADWETTQSGLSHISTVDLYLNSSTSNDGHNKLDSISRNTVVDVEPANLATDHHLSQPEHTLGNKIVLPSNLPNTRSGMEIPQPQIPRVQYGSTAEPKLWKRRSHNLTEKHADG